MKAAHASEQSVIRSRRGIRRRLTRPRISGLNASTDHSHARHQVWIALIDPKPLTRQSILEMLANSLPEQVRLVGASSYAELTEGAETDEKVRAEKNLNIIILYIRNAGLRDAWVQEQLQLIRLQRPEIPIIMISDRDDADEVISALNWGVRGYIPTSIGAEVAIAALTFIGAGGTYIPQSVLRKEEDEQGDPAAELHLNLTARELSVIDLLREGKPNKLIAFELNMQESTVKVHVSKILKKLRVSNRTQATSLVDRLFAEKLR